MTRRPRQRDGAVRFRLYPERRRGLYVLVFVWPSAKAMRAHAKRTGDPASGKRTVHGYCSHYIIRSYKTGRCRTHPLFSEVHLYRQALTMRIVTHELFHATVGWGRRVGFDFSRLDAEDSVNAPEERIAHVHDTLCSDFMRRATALGLYKDGNSRPVMRR